MDQLHQLLLVHGGDLHWQEKDALTHKIEIFNHAAKTKVKDLTYYGYSDPSGDQLFHVSFEYAEMEDQIDAWAKDAAEKAQQYSPWGSNYEETYQKTKKYYQRKLGLEKITPEPTPYVYTGEVDDSGASSSQEDVNRRIDEMIANGEL